MPPSTVAPAATPTETAKADAGKDGNDDKDGKEGKGAAEGEGQDGPQAGDPIPGSYVVLFADASGPRGEAEIGKAARDLTGRVGGRVKDVYTTVLRGFSAKLSAGQAREMARQPGVASVTQDVVLEASTASSGAHSMPEGDGRSTQGNAPWHLDRIDQAMLPLSGTFDAKDASRAHIYIFDSGVRATHEEFGGRVKDGPAGTDHDDCSGHGTAVAGAAAGKTFGVARNATIHRVRVLGCEGYGPATDALEAIDWVTKNGPRPAVVTMSWGVGGTPEDPLYVAIQNSIRAGITYVTAANNDESDNCRSIPTGIPEVITVGAVDRTDRRFSKSSDPCIDLFAPGRQIRTAGKDSDTATTVESGTSFAAPLAAGAAAVYLSAHPDATPKQVADALAACAGTGLVVNPGPGSPNRLLSTACDEEGPRLTNPGRQNTTKGRPVTISITGKTGTGAGTIRYSATGLPEGVSIDAATGVISGTPAKIGTTVTKITATDGKSSASISFAWDVNYGHGRFVLADDPTFCLDNNASFLLIGNPIRLHELCGNWLMGVDGRLVFQREDNDHCAAVSGKESPDGPLILLDLCSDSATQVWEHRPDGTLVNPATGRCLTAPRVGAGVDLTLAPCHGREGQKWRLPPFPEGNPLTVKTIEPVATRPGTEVSLRLPATSADTTQRLRYSATGLPAGVSIDPDTGIITGKVSPGQATTTVTVTVTHAGGPSASASFTWQVADGQVIGVNRQCLDIAGGARDNTPVQLFSCNPGAGQSWSVRSDGRLEGLGHCLTPRGGSTGPGTPVGISPCSDAATQVWKPGPDGTLRNTASGLCLTGPAGGGPAAQLVLAECAGTAPQIWTLPTDPAAGLFTVLHRQDLLIGAEVDIAIEGRAGHYRVSGLPEGLSVDAVTGRITGRPAKAGAGAAVITATGPDGVIGRGAFTWSVHQGRLTGPGGKCAGNQGGDARDGTGVVLTDCDDDVARRWTVRDDGTLEVMGKCATVDKDATAHGSPIVIGECGPRPSQLWQPRDDGTLRNPASGRCLSGPAREDSTQLILADCTGNAEQRWRLLNSDSQDPEPGDPKPEDPEPGDPKPEDPEPGDPKPEDPEPEDPSPSGYGAPGAITHDNVSWCAESSGGPVTLWDCNQLPQQTWMVNADGRVLNQQSKQCMTPENDGTAAGTRLVVAPCSDSSKAQQWRQEPDGTIRNVASNRCLSTAELGYRAPVVLADCTGNTEQRWRLPNSDPQGSKPEDPSSSGYGAPGAITHVSGSWCAESGGGPLILWDCNQSPPQTWMVNADGRVLNRRSNQCMTPENDGTDAGTRLVVAPCSDSSKAQQWRQQSDGTIRNIASGRCLSTTELNHRAPLVLADCAAADNHQRWKLPTA